MAIKSMVFFSEIDNFARICLETVNRVFLRSLITNLKSESQNSKKWIQYGDQFHYTLVKLHFHVALLGQNIAKTCQKYFQYFIAIEILSQNFRNYCKIFHRNITILTF